MRRRRFLVALVPPPPLLHQLRGLRAMVGGPDRERIPPHVTLVPPFNLAAAGHHDLRAALRDVATGTEPFQVVLGPAASFAPANPTLHLEVRGAEPAGSRHPAGLHDLRDRLRVGAMARPDRHDFVPHLTLARKATEDVTGAATSVLHGRLPAWTVDRLTLFEQVHTDRGTGWEPLAEEPFGGPVVVGRGGVELHLRTIQVTEPITVETVASDEPDGEHPTVDRAGTERPAPTGAVGPMADGPPVPLVVVAELPRTPGEVIGRAVGHVAGGAATLCDLEVAPPHRGMGVARQVLARWCTDAARQGAAVVVAASREPVLLQLGFTQVADLQVRRLPVSSGE